MKTKSTTDIPTNKAKQPAHKRRIFLVDDHPVTRQGLTMLLDQEKDLTICGEADNAPAAVDSIPKQAPDLALIDITLNGTSGIELLKNVRALLPDLPVLIISMHDEELYAERAFRAGARGYIMKHEASEKILDAVRMVLEGGLYMSDKMKNKMLNRMMSNPRQEPSFSLDNLSDREMEVFQLIGNGFSTRDIAARLNLSVKTIDSYREHLKLKLQMEKGTELMRFAIQWVKSQGIA